MSEQTGAEVQQEEANRAFRVEDMGSYRDGFRNLMRLVYVQLFVIILLAGFNGYYIYNVVPQDSFFAVSPGGTKRQLTALALPNAGVETISRWTAAAVTEVLTFSFNDIDERMSKAQRLFSDEGWVSFSTAVFNSRMLKAVMNNQQIQTCIPASPPIVMAEGMVAPGQYGWVMSAPIILAVRSGEKPQTLRSNVRLIVVRMPTQQNPMGLGIRTFMAM